MTDRPSVKDLAELIISKRFGGHSPFKGSKPFVIVQSQTDTPRALVTDELLQDRAEQYEVALTCTNQNEANRFVFQYTHELAHFYLTPLEHPFLEIIAVAVSFCLLTDCANEWRRNNWGTYASRFEDYKRIVVEDAKRSLGLQSYFGQVPIELVLQRDSEAARSCDVGPPHLLAGVILADTIMQKANTWSSLLSIHKHLIFSTDDVNLRGESDLYVNFGAWMREEAKNREELFFRKQIVRLFGPIFGIESTSRVSSCLRVLSRCFSSCWT